MNKITLEFNISICFYVIAVENGGSPVTVISKLATANADKQLEEVNPGCNHINETGNSNTKEEKANTEESDLPERYKTRLSNVEW